MKQLTIRPPELRLSFDDEINADLFAGGGGASTGIEAAGFPVHIALNHDPVALAVHRSNHPNTQHLEADVWEVKPLEVTGGRRVGLLWASPDCKFFSRAKGGKPRNSKIRSLANAVIRWAGAYDPSRRPRLICLENVIEFESWGPLHMKGPLKNRPIKDRKGEHFRRWKRNLENLGYSIEHRVLDASHYGAPTRRKRFFLIARCDGVPIVWPEPTHGPGLQPFRTAAECIDWKLPCPSIFGRKKPLAEKTMWRIAQGLQRFVLDNPRPFIVKVNHGKMEARVEQLDLPLSTVTATQRGHAIVTPILQQSGYGERKGQRARTLNIHEPLGTIVGCGQKHALVSAFLNRHFGDPNRADGKGGRVIGDTLERPLPTITCRDHHTLAAITLAHFRGTDPSQPGAQPVGAQPVDAPLPTISAGGIHVGEVRAFLTAYYGSDGKGGQELGGPLRTVTSTDRFGLVTISGVDYEIADIGFRMLEPHELLRAQFGRFAERYDMSPAKTKKDKVRLIGNSVAPEVAEAIVLANAPQRATRAA